MTTIITTRTFAKVKTLIHLPGVWVASGNEGYLEPYTEDGKPDTFLFHGNKFAVDVTSIAKMGFEYFFELEQIPQG